MFLSKSGSYGPSAVLAAALLIFSVPSRATAAGSLDEDLAGIFDGGAMEALSPPSSPPAVSASPEDQRAREPKAGPVRVPHIFQPFGTPIPGSDWEEADPEDSVADDNPSAPDKVDFWDRLQDKAFDQLCKQLKIPLKGGLDIGEGGLEAKYKRYMRHLPSGKLGLVDEGELNLSLGHTEGLWDFLEDRVGVSLFVRARLEGQSLVVRPLESEKSCDEIGRLIDLRDIKTVLPLKPERISKMAVGELWKLPLTLRVGFGGSLGGTLTEDLPASITLGTFREDVAGVSLYRLSEDVLRFRFRLDHAQVREAGGTATYVFPTSQFGLPGAENVLVKLLDKQLAREINKYMETRLSLRWHRRKGRKAVIEFLLDPNDPEQMRTLVEVIKGDLDMLLKLRRIIDGVKKRLAEGGSTAEENIAELEREHAGKFGKDSSFAGIDEYIRRNRPFRLRLPFLLDYESSKGRNEERLIVLDEAGGEYHVYTGQKRKHTGMIDIPFLGNLTKHDRQKSAQVFSYRDGDGNEESPVAVYVQQEGFLRHKESSAKNMAGRADDIMRYAGARGNGDNPRTGVPIKAVFPEPPVSEDGGRRGGNPTYRRGMTSLTVAFHQQAVRDILNADAGSVAAAFANTLGEEQASLMRWVLANGEVGEDGRLSYDRGDLYRHIRRTAHTMWEETQDILRDVYWTCRRAAKIVADLAKARLAGSFERQAEAFLDVLTGAGKSGLAYDKIVKVLIQLSDPEDLTAEFYVRMVKKVKGEEDIDARYSLHEGGGQDDLLKRMSKTRARFAEPSRLAD